MAPRILSAMLWISSIITTLAQAKQLCPYGGARMWTMWNTRLCLWISIFAKPFPLTWYNTPEHGFRYDQLMIPWRSYIAQNDVLLIGHLIPNYDHHTEVSSIVQDQKHDPPSTLAAPGSTLAGHPTGLKWSLVVTMVQHYQQLGKCG